MGRRRTDLTALRTRVRAGLAGLPDQATLVPHHLFALFGRSMTYQLLRLREIPATQTGDGGIYLIDRAALVAWLHQDAAGGDAGPSHQ